MKNSIIEQLRKIDALAESGVAGERENAQSLLESLCRKYGVDRDSLLSGETKTFKFVVTKARDFTLFKQCCFHVLQVTEIKYRKRREAVWMDMTQAEAIDLRACHLHYRRLYREEEELLYEAFVARNRIYGPASDENEAPEMDAERLARLLALMRSLSDNSWKKPVAKLTA